MSDGPARPLALVTGASSGIGAAYAGKLAGKGFDLVLVSRDRARLTALARRLAALHGVTADPLPADLSLRSDVEALERRIRATNRLRFLVNAAGFLTKGTFAEADVEGQDAMIRVHLLATVRLTRAALPAMIRSGRRCAVVNVSSVAGFGTSVGNITYCATKAYLNSFTQGLSLELADTNVAVQALCPGYTRTEIHRRAGVRSETPRSWWLEPEDVVDASFRALADGRVFCIPGLRYRAVVALARFIPQRIQQRLKAAILELSRDKHRDQGRSG